MKTFATALFLLAFGTLSAQQNTFTISKKGTEYSAQQVKEAMSAANWCGYFYEDQRHVMKFNDGTVVELLSYKELANAKVKVEESCVERYVSEDKATYVIKDGSIVRTATRPLKIRIDLEK